MRAECEAFRASFAKVKGEIGKVMVGQQPVVDAVLVCLFCGGNVLLEGVPGLAKTTAVAVWRRQSIRAFSDCSLLRICCQPT